jgi:hypothetical protein
MIIDAAKCEHCNNWRLFCGYRYGKMGTAEGACAYLEDLRKPWNHQL